MKKGKEKSGKVWSLLWINFSFPSARSEIKGAFKWGQKPWGRALWNVSKKEGNEEQEEEEKKMQKIVSLWKVDILAYQNLSFFD